MEFPCPSPHRRSFDSCSALTTAPLRKVYHRPMTAGSMAGRDGVDDQRERGGGGPLLLLRLAARTGCGA